MKLTVHAMRRKAPVRAEAMVSAMLRGLRDAKKVKAAESRVAKGERVKAFRRRARFRALPKATAPQVVDVNSTRTTMIGEMRSQ